MAGSEEFRIASAGIEDGGRLPRKYTQEGQGARKNISPPLEWYNLPEDTKSLALVVDDVDCPYPDIPTPSTYWVVVNIPPSLKGLPEGFSGNQDDSHGSDLSLVKEGMNGQKVPGWCGPALPSNIERRLEFKLYALSVEVKLGKKVTKEKLMEEMNGHVLGEAVLTALF